MATFTFDSYFSNAPVCNHIHQHSRAYVGDLKFNRKVIFRGQQMRADEMAAQIPCDARKKVNIAKRTQWYFTKKIRLTDYTHAVRVVLLWKSENDKEAAKILITNQTHWEVSRVAARLILSYVAGKTKADFRADTQCQDAVIRRFEIIGEAARRLSDETRASLPQLPWEAMIGMRNLLIHEYDGVDLDVVWETIQADLPTLAQAIQSLVPPDV